MRVKLLICAQSCALDSRTNSVSLFHVLEAIRVPGYPIVITPLSIVALLELDDGEPINPEIELRVFLGNQQLYAGPLQTNFQVRRMSRTVAEFNGFVVPAPGLLRVLLHSAGHDFASWEVPCEQIGPPQLDLHLQPAEQRPAEQGH